MVLIGVDDGWCREAERREKTQGESLISVSSVLVTSLTES